MKVRSQRTVVWVALALVTGGRAPLSAQAPEKTCADPTPKDCAKVKLLGEDKDCTCFVCNPDTKQRKVVCTKDDDQKKALMKLREPEGSPSAPEAPK
jgi:hypothetical protein